MLRRSLYVGMITLNLVIPDARRAPAGRDPPARGDARVQVCPEPWGKSNEFVLDFFWKILAVVLYCPNQPTRHLLRQSRVHMEHGDYRYPDSGGPSPSAGGYSPYSDYRAQHRCVRLPESPPRGPAFRSNPPRTARRDSRKSRSHAF